MGQIVKACNTSRQAHTTFCLFQNIPFPVLKTLQMSSVKIHWHFVLGALLTVVSAAELTLG
jgi:hypothetical protein